VSAGARVAVPGPVWGARPRRVEPPGDPGRVAPAPLRGAPDGAWARARSRLTRSGPEALADRARRLAARLAGVQGGVPPAPKVEALGARLAAEGLAPEPIVLALAVAGAAMAAATGLAPRANQYHGAVLLLGQRLVELDTGEGKSVMVALAAAVAALAGAPVHVLTANPYLAARDAAAFAPFYALLGLRAAAVAETDDDAARRAAWGAEIAYAAARTLGFDELRDELAAAGGDAAEPLLRGLCVAIVDEADSVLLDEARMPLVIAQARPDAEGRARAWQALDLARRLAPGTDFEPGAGTVRITPQGERTLEAMVRAEGSGAGWLNARHRVELVGQALAALHLLHRDVDYLVTGEGIVLVDAGTGRASPMRQLARQLHALVAIKEGVAPPPSTDVRAAVTYPRLLARYHHLCGTSGTLCESAAELRRDYGLAALRVARTRASRLRSGPMRLFADRTTQFHAAAARAGALAAAGRPVLVGTDSVADSRRLADVFAALGRPVAVLDARHDDDEAALVARAGEAGRITVTTQMAGRGTDIRLGPGAAGAGGLHVLNLQHNRSPRIDRQLAGRAARQADPGSAEHWVRLDAAPLADGRAAAPLATMARLLRWLAACADPAPADPARPPGRAPLAQRLAARLLWRACQAWWRLEDGSTRGDAIRHDRRWSSNLHFATVRTPENQSKD